MKAVNLKVSNNIAARSGDHRRAKRTLRRAGDKELKTIKETPFYHKL